MKSVISFAVGVAVGIFVQWYGVRELTHTAKNGASSVYEMASEKKFDSCKADFLQKSSCLEMEPQRVCDGQILKECGEDPAATARSKDRTEIR